MKTKQVFYEMPDKHGGTQTLCVDKRVEKIKTYWVSFFYTESGKAPIKACSMRQAEKKVYTELENNGLEKLDYDCEDRDYEITDVEVV